MQSRQSASNAVESTLPNAAPLIPPADLIGPDPYWLADDEWFLRLEAELLDGIVAAILSGALPLSVKHLGGPSGQDPHPSGSPQSIHGGGEHHVVGITSDLAPGRPGREVYREMALFEQELRNIEGVRSVSVQPGEGGWDGGAEKTWIVAYTGDGEAVKLIARTGRDKKQQAVIIWGPPRGEDRQPLSTLTFAVRLNPIQQKAVEGLLVRHGLGGGWSWYKQGGQRRLRLGYVPQFAGEGWTAEMHIEAVDVLARLLDRGVKASQSFVSVQVMTEETYGQYIGG